MTQKTIALSALYITFSLLANASNADDGTKWIDAEGSGYNKEEALIHAQDDAVNQVVPTRVLTTFSSFISSADSAQILKARKQQTLVLRQGLVLQYIILDSKCTIVGEGLDAIPVYWVKIKAEVLNLGTPDPFFNVNLDIQPKSERYDDGQNVKILVSANDTCKVTILLLSARNDVYLVLPNPTNRDRHIIPGSIIEIPATMQCLEGLKATPETMIAIATREGYPDFFSPEEQEYWELVPSKTGSLLYVAKAIGATEMFVEWLNKLPYNKWTIDLIPYVITK